MRLLKEWFIVDQQEQKQGPFTLEELKKKKEQGEISDSTQVWSQKFGQWIPYSIILEKELYYRDTPMFMEDSESKVSFSEEAKIAKERSPRPWVRFWARMLDYGIFFGLGSGLLVAIDRFPTLFSPIYLLIILTFLWVWLESFLLATWGYTPGKWWLKTQIRRQESLEKLYFRESIDRSLSVWFLGLGAAIPILSLITMIVANVKLSNLGMTTWDRRGEFIVYHDHIGLLRILFTIVFFVAIAILFLAEYKHLL